MEPQIIALYECDFVAIKSICEVVIQTGHS